ncbi:SMP-30/gluconolactonase/LRE family protein [Herbiconiux sp. KACC 21604]|uniref:SMP-30/gluconolactonase/LRE family protein n=1 Tax=unclassified Herbiconiux TaxID=2618217 RepID=UPI0014914041|nr:SMP-30/gluconolactonase/LRE family protein [Herbiconiux sp. SALV-R1]QJU55223.1 SMP-30/gluconolactonase/LRE family protein [Herbiconiux sp. SALV-R1]WPO86388.1 SMP-30/gluconolactonase/LRE family protein [Herbiconiux sp. KACC 21604]
MRAEQLTPPLCAHGEGPATSERWSGVRWVDMLAGDVLELQPDGSVLRRTVGGVAALLRPRVGAGWVVALENSIALSDGDDLDADLTKGPRLWDARGVRSNEGACSPDGRLHLGTMHVDAEPGAGFLLEIDADGRARRELHGVTISNGLGFLADGATACYVDTATGRIDRLTWNPVWGLHDRRPWVVLDGSRAGGGYDGLAVDSEDGVWVALFGGGAVHRYDRAGKLDAVVELPVRQPTAMAFDGRDLVITTSRHGLGHDAEPSAGALFRVTDVGVTGGAVHAYAG